MADLWIVCKKEDETLTAIAVVTGEGQARDVADDGDYVAIPVAIGRQYADLISESIVGAITFSNVSIYTLIQQVKAKMIEFEARISALEA